MELPAEIHEIRGEHDVAMDRTNDIHGYVNQAINCLLSAKDVKCGAFTRSGLIRQAEDYLDAVIRFAQCAKDNLNRAYVVPR